MLNLSKFRISKKIVSCLLSFIIFFSLCSLVASAAPPASYLQEISVASVDAPEYLNLVAVSTRAILYFNQTVTGMNLQASDFIVTVEGTGERMVSVSAGFSGRTLTLTFDDWVLAYGQQIEVEISKEGAEKISNDLNDILTGQLRRAADNAAHRIAGENHSMALKHDGTVWTWGNNGSGRLGDGSVTNRLIPVSVAGGADENPDAWLQSVAAVAAGSSHSMALKHNGTVWAWGNNGSGRLGDGTTTSSSNPVQVIDLTDAIAVSAGGGFSLALRADGTVWAWGSNGSGQLGSGMMADSSLPVQVSGLTGVVSIAAGGSHSLALRADGTVWAWGSNGTGQLGDGTTAQQIVPVQVRANSGDGEFLQDIVAVSAGYSHSLVLKEDGTVWAWGSNGSGRLGDGTTTNRLMPVQVSGLTGVVSIAAGYSHSLVLKEDGTVWAWGYNEYGELGDGTIVQKTSPVQVLKGASNGNGIFLTGINSVAAGSHYSLVVRIDGTVLAWGVNWHGRLGDGTTGTRLVPVVPGAVSPPIYEDLFLTGSNKATLLFNVPVWTTSEMICRTDLLVNVDGEPRAAVMSPTVSYGAERTLVVTLEGVGLTAGQAVTVQITDTGASKVRAFSLVDKAMAAGSSRTSVAIGEPLLYISIGSAQNGTTTGGGTYAEGQSVTLSASPNQNYNFDGWYNESDEKVSSLPNYTFIAERDITLTPSFVVMQSSALQVTTVGNGFVRLNEGTTPLPADYCLQHARGTSITLTATAEAGYIFAYWADANSTSIISNGPVYQITMGAGINVKAVFNKIPTEEDTHFTVVFKDRSGRILQSTNIEIGTPATPPGNPVLVGYNFLGWDRAFDNVTSNMIISARYERQPDTYTVTVVNGTLSTGGQSGLFTFDTKITVAAGAAPEGQKFSHWEQDSVKIGISSTYSFFAPMKPTTLTAVYADEAVVLIKEPFIVLSNYVMMDTENKTMAFTANRIVPDGYTLVESGVMLLKYNGSLVDELTVDTPGAIRGRIKNDSTDQFYIRKLNIADNDTWHARAYLIYSDTSGNIITVYSENTVSQTM